MKAIVQEAYGSPEVLRLTETDVPAVGDDDVLVRVGAAGVNAGDYFSMRGVRSSRGSLSGSPDRGATCPDGTSPDVSS